MKCKESREINVLGALKMLNVCVRKQAEAGAAVSGVQLPVSLSKQNTGRDTSDTRVTSEASRTFSSKRVLDLHCLAVLWKSF